MSAYRTPTSFSEDIRTPFEDLGMGKWSDDERKEFFAGKRVLDVGSGYEGLARGLFKLFADEPASEKPWVVNLNPQVADWHMEDKRENGELKSIRCYKRTDIEAAIKMNMRIGRDNEDIEGYFAGRTVVGGLVQQLPFPDNSFDIVTSTWGFPICLYDCGGSNRDHETGYREVMRVGTLGGDVRLGPVRHGRQREHTVLRLRQVENIAAYMFHPATNEGQVLELYKAA